MITGQEILDNYEAVKDTIKNQTLDENINTVKDLVTVVMSIFNQNKLGFAEDQINNLRQFLLNLDETNDEAFIRFITSVSAQFLPVLIGVNTKDCVLIAKKYNSLYTIKPHLSKQIYSEIKASKGNDSGRLK